MDFSLTAEQSAMVETARSFAKKAVAPEVEKYDRPGAPYPAEWIAKLGKLGFSRLAVPPEMGGVGSGTLSAGLALEEIATACAGLATALLGAIAGVVAVEISASPEAAKRLISDDMERGGPGWRASLAGLPYAPFEAGAGGKLSGKAFGVIGAGHASWYASLVRESGVTCYALPGGMEGLKVEPLSDPLGLRAASLGKLTLKDCEPPESSRLGEIEPNSLLALIAPLQGCIAVGCARAALDAAENYGRERYQGGDQIIRHDTVAHLILANRARVNAARSHLQRVMATNDSLINQKDGSLRGAPDVVEAVLARIFATDAALQAGLDAVQCFGGYGYMHDYPVEKRMRDARSIGMLFGTSPELLTRIKYSLEEA